MKFLGEGYQKLEHEQQTQTDATETYQLHLRVVKKTCAHAIKDVFFTVKKSVSFDQRSRSLAFGVARVGLPTEVNFGRFSHFARQ